MALATCRECGHRVSTAAATCPGCGVANPAGTRAGQRAADDQKGGSGAVAQGVFEGIVGCIMAPVLLAAVCLVLFLLYSSCFGYPWE